MGAGGPGEGRRRRKRLVVVVRPAGEEEELPEPPAAGQGLHVPLPLTWNRCRPLQGDESCSARWPSSRETFEGTKKKGMLSLAYRLFGTTCSPARHRLESPAVGCAVQDP